MGWVVIADVVAVVAAAAAAYFWLRAARVQGPKALVGVHVGQGVAHVSTRPIEEYVRTSGRFNQLGAIMAAVSALAQAMAMVVRMILA